METTFLITEHHPACPGILRHRVVVHGERGDHWPGCSICGPIPAGIDAFTSVNDARSAGLSHEHDEPCPGGKCIVLVD